MSVHIKAITDDFAAKIATAPETRIFSRQELELEAREKFKAVFDALEEMSKPVTMKFGPDATVRFVVESHDQKFGLLTGFVIATKPHTAPRRISMDYRNGHLWLKDTAQTRASELRMVDDEAKVIQYIADGLKNYYAFGH